MCLIFQEKRVWDQTDSTGSNWCRQKLTVVTCLYYYHNIKHTPPQERARKRPCVRALVVMPPPAAPCLQWKLRLPGGGKDHERTELDRDTFNGCLFGVTLVLVACPTTFYFKKKKLRTFSQERYSALTLTTSNWSRSRPCAHWDWARANRS